MAEPAKTLLKAYLVQAGGAVGLFVLAIAALLSGTDRLTKDFPNSPALVGWPYDTGAAQARAILAFVQRGPAGAMTYSRRSILSDPISASPISMLGRAQLASGQLAEAHKTFEVSGQLGWRDELTQIYWLDQALQANDLRVASERLDALLRQTPDNENRDRFLAIVSETPEGRMALAKRLKAVPAWAAAYVTDLHGIPPEHLLQRVDVVQHAGRGIWDCPQTAIFVQNLIRGNLLNQAQAVWRMNCATSNSLVYDGGFDHIDTTGTATGFEWTISGRGDVMIAAAKDGNGNPRLDLSVQASVSVPIVRQLLLLDPGRYRLTWRTPETSPTAASKLKVSLTCKLDLRDALSGSPLPGQKDVHMQEFVVDSACRDRLLTFWLAPNEEVHLDDVALTQVQ